MDKMPTGWDPCKYKPKRFLMLKSDFVMLCHVE